MFRQMAVRMRRSELKKPLVNFLFRDLTDAERAHVSAQLGGYIAPATLLSYTSPSYNPWADSRFASHQVASTKVIISELEKAETVRVLQEGNIFQEHSGATDASLFYCGTQAQVHSEYKKLFPLIQEAVRKHQGRIHGSGRRRSLKHFVRSVMKRKGLLKKKQSHACPICTRLLLDRKKLAQLKAARVGARGRAEEERLDEQIAEVASHVDYGEFHQQRRLHQRRATQVRRDSLEPLGVQMLAFMDYVSFYLASGAKKNVLVVEADTRDGAIIGGEVTHRSVRARLRARLPCPCPCACPYPCACAQACLHSPSPS